MNRGARAALVVGSIAVAALGLRLALDRTAPDLGWSQVPPATLRGVASFEALVVDQGTGLGAVDLVVDGRAPVAMARDGDVVRGEVDTTALSDGPHLVAVVARDRSLWRNTAVLEANPRVDNTPPRVAVAPVPPTARGSAATVTVRADEPLATATVTFGSRIWRLHRVEADAYRAWLGVGLDTPLGPSTLVVHAVDGAGNGATVEATLEVADRAADPGVPLDDDLVPAPAEAAEEERLRDGSFALDQDTASWPAAWVWPIDGAVAVPYGAAGRDGRHAGVDLVAPEGTPVVAVGDGLVALADDLPVHGGHVIVDHGRGVLTTYAHLAEIDVAPGESVHAGDRLGTLGSTGDSRAPHVHFEIVVGGAPIDPAGWRPGTE